MSRETSPCIVGDYWLDKRRDGISPEVWQVAHYSDKSRSVVYRSTKRRDVEGAEAFLRSYEAAARSKRTQDAEHAELLPHLFNYLREHGPDVHRLDTIKSSFRAWIGFLMQDELGTDARVAEITKNTLARFRRWRMEPHGYVVEWGGKTFRHTSKKGVKGETVQRNIEDLRAALNHAEAENRIVAPKLASVDKKLRSGPRELVLTPKQIGAMLGYAKGETAIWRELALIVATGCRPGHALRFDPAQQWQGEVIDLQHPDAPVTNKRAAVVPVIDPLRPVLEAWKAAPHESVKSRKTWWRTMLRVLALPDEVEAYTIRHTVATMLDEEGVPGAQISGIIGHLPRSRGTARTTSQHYLHYDPLNCPKARRALTKFFRACAAESDKWAADHSRTIPVRGKPISLARIGMNG